MNLEWRNGVTCLMEPIRLGHIIVEPERNRVVNEDGIHRITPREMEVLAYLIRNGTRVVPREELLERVWNDVVVNGEALTLVISRLRAVLSDNPTQPRFIETIPKKGYRLMIEAVDAAEPENVAVAKRTGWVWVTVLAVLLFVMTALFMVVRMEYERVESAQTETLSPSE